MGHYNNSPPKSSDRRDTGGVLDLITALEQDQDSALFPYARETGRNRREKLALQAADLVKGISEAAPGRRIVTGEPERWQEVCDSKPGRRRGPCERLEDCEGVSHWVPGKSCLEKLCRHALRQGGIVVARSLDRFLRSAHFDGRETAADLWPTEEEFQWLREITYGVRLATLWPPWLSLAEVRSRVQLAAPKAGPTPVITDALVAEVLRRAKVGALQVRYVGRKTVWLPSVRQLDKSLGLTKSTVERILRANEKAICDATLALEGEEFVRPW